MSLHRKSKWTSQLQVELATHHIGIDSLDIRVDVNGLSKDDQAGLLSGRCAAAGHPLAVMLIKLEEQDFSQN